MVELEGRVVKKRIAIGSKSEHDAVCLTSAAHEYVLRRKEGSSFFDPALEKLVGKKIRATGEILGGYTLLMSDWTEI